MNFTTEEYKTIIRTLINENNRLRTELKTTEEILGEFMMKSDNSKPSSESSKLKLFMEIFDALSGPDTNDVKLDRFISELVSTGRFTEDEVKNFVRKAMANGHIYERKSGYYAKA